MLYFIRAATLEEYKPVKSLRTPLTQISVFGIAVTLHWKAVSMNNMLMANMARLDTIIWSILQLEKELEQIIAGRPS